MAHLVPGLALGIALSCLPAHIASDPPPFADDLIIRYSARQGVESAPGVGANVGDTVARWIDLSGNGRHAVQPDAGARHILQSVGGKQVLRANNTDIIVPDSALAAIAGGEYSLYVVARLTSGLPASYYAVCDSIGEALRLYASNGYYGSFAIGGAYTGSVLTDSAVSVASMRSDGSTVVFGRDAATLDTRPAGSATRVFPLSFGGFPSGGGTFFNGYYAEILLYKHKRTSGEHAQVLAYLDGLWGL